VKKVKVAILGAGSAGLSARSEVAKVTDSYLVADPGPLGTTCARVGCMPSKVFVQIARDFHRRNSFGRQGIRGAEHLFVDPEAALTHVRQLRDRFVDAVLEDMESWRYLFPS
jgi:dihydrolipoamide dehydrogenase